MQICSKPIILTAGVCDGLLNCSGSSPILTGSARGEGRDGAEGRHPDHDKGVSLQQHISNGL